MSDFTTRMQEMKEKAKLHFWRPDYSETFDDADVFEVFDPSDLELCAEEYAEFYHNERDGWEARWPIEFHIAKPDGTFLGVVEVDREARPHFCGRKRK
jgi:hypothetical protein